MVEIDDESVVEFIRIERNLYNVRSVEFTKMFLYSELTSLFIRKSSHNVYCNTIGTLDGTYQLYTLDEGSFWDTVKGKRFIVTCDKSLRQVIVHDKEKLASLVDTIFCELDKGEDALFNSSTEAGWCYQFTEI